MYSALVLNTYQFTIMYVLLSSVPYRGAKQEINEGGSLQKKKEKTNVPVGQGFRIMVVEWVQPNSLIRGIKDLAYLILSYGNSVEISNKDGWTWTHAKPGTHSLRIKGKALHL